MDNLEMARTSFIRDIFGSSDIEGSSHESLGCEDNSVPLVDEISISNVIYEQDFNIVSYPIPIVGKSFGSVDELLETYQDHVKEKCFTVVIRSSTKDEDGRLKYVWLSSDRGRNTYFEKHSKRVNCPAKVRAIRGGDNRWSNHFGSVRKDEELEEIVVKDKAEDKAVKAKAKANQLA
ncbi:hypothetical protein Scep_011710 [Stephania cephalantha]|uniref:FAR1 domain-containing protein n=1 Tax=Stephania cephalantha TaxID=152367 RepID=A0AAP0JFV5_9MAGN